jgi:hypothetical protein
VNAQARADFHFEVVVDGEYRYLFRDLIPKDFYWFALCENDFPDLSPTLQYLLIICMLLDEDERILDQIPKRHIGPLTHWIGNEVLQEKIMKLTQWYELSFHLCKQRFDYTMDWLETQPVPKILLMAQTLTKFAKEQEREMRKARRKK